MEYFKKELLFIINEDIRTKTKRVLKKVNEKFFTEPASSTGKYHPSYAQGEGGLYRHTRAAVGIANDLFRLNMFDCFTSDTKDYIIAALILHDTCKSGINWEGRYTKHEHPILVGDLIREALGSAGEPDCEYVEAVSALIASHMGQWNTAKWSYTKLPVPTTDAEKFVHLCDYLASRKFLEYIFEEEENND